MVKEVKYSYIHANELTQPQANLQQTHMEVLARTEILRMEMPLAQLLILQHEPADTQPNVFFGLMTEAGFIDGHGKGCNAKRYNKS